MHITECRSLIVVLPISNHGQPGQGYFMKITIGLLATILLIGVAATSIRMAAGSDEAVVKIHSNTKWSGSILDSSFDSSSKDGSGDESIPIVCTSYGIYSLTIQKQSATGSLMVSGTRQQDG